MSTNSFHQSPSQAITEAKTLVPSLTESKWQRRFESTTWTVKFLLPCSNKHDRWGLRVVLEANGHRRCPWLRDFIREYKTV